MRSIRILEPARRDLVAGYRFYERQAEGIGRYFLTVWKLISSGATSSGSSAAALRTHAPSSYWARIRSRPCGWNLLMPAVMVLGFAFIFSGDEARLFKVGLLGTPAAEGRPALLDSRHIQVIPQGDEDAALTKLRQHQMDLLLDFGARPPCPLARGRKRGSVVERSGGGGAGWGGDRPGLAPCE